TWPIWSPRGETLVMAGGAFAKPPKAARGNNEAQATRKKRTPRGIISVQSTKLFWGCRRGGRGGGRQGGEMIGTEGRGVRGGGGGGDRCGRRWYRRCIGKWIGSRRWILWRGWGRSGGGWCGRRWDRRRISEWIGRRRRGRRCDTRRRGRRFRRFGWRRGRSSR